MKNALISPSETVYSYDGSSLGDRVAEVSGVLFEVAEPLFWVECSDDIIAGGTYYDAAAGVIKSLPLPPELTASGSEPNVVV